MTTPRPWPDGIYDRSLLLLRAAPSVVWRCLMASALLLAAWPGCSRARPPIDGAVTFDGISVEDGSISFAPTDGNGPSTGGRIVDGRYELRGEAAPFPGKKIVRICAMRKTGRRINDSIAGTVDETQPYIPDIYNSRSTLTCEIGDGSSRQINFHLRSP